MPSPPPFPSRFGYEPEGAENGAIALKVLLDCNDIIAELTRSNGSRMWDEEAWTGFVGKRLITWLAVLEATATRKGSGDFIFGSKISYADLAICHLFDMLGTQLGMRDYLEKHAPSALKLADRCAKREGVAKMFTEQAAAYGTKYAQSRRCRCRRLLACWVARSNSLTPAPSLSPCWLFYVLPCAAALAAVRLKRASVNTLPRTCTSEDAAQALRAVS